MSFTTIILAGGLGKRMNSTLPKVLHCIQDKPMIYYVIRNALTIGSANVLIVVGKYRKMIDVEIERFFNPAELIKIHYIDQPETIENNKIKVMGTGDAVKCCLPFFMQNNTPLNSKVLILSGDVPMITSGTIQRLLDTPNSILITELEKPFGCGRIFLDKKNTIHKIVEEKDCNDEEKQCKLVNCGIYNINVDVLLECIPQITNQNKNQEYYLTDLVEIAIKKQIDIMYYMLPIQNQYEIININTQDELLQANNIEIFSAST